MTLSPGTVFNPHRAFYGVWIPQWLEEQREVSEKAKKCYAYLTLFAGDKGRAWPSYNTLAEKLHVSRRHVIRILHELFRYRLIRITHISDSIRGHQANVYEFLWHEWMQHKEDSHFKLVVPDEPPLAISSHDKSVTQTPELTPPPPSDIFDISPSDPEIITPSDIGDTPLVTPMSPKKNNNKRINCKRVKVGRPMIKPKVETAFQPNKPTNQPPPIPSIGQEEWIAMLQEGHPETDVEGELKSFLVHCNRTGRSANRHGFAGWIKKASPAIRLPKRKLRYTF